MRNGSDQSGNLSEVCDISSCYSPPKNTNNEPTFEEIKRLVGMHRNNSMWVSGNFNLLDIDWEVKSMNN